MSSRRITRETSLNLALDDDGKPVLLLDGERLPAETDLAVDAGTLAEFMTAWVRVTAGLLAEPVTPETSRGGMN